MSLVSITYFHGFRGCSLSLKRSDDARIDTTACNVASLCEGRRRAKLQALLYDIFLPTTAITDYAIGLGKVSANQQFFFHARARACVCVCVCV